jgi:hypothetical protein
MNLTVEPHVSDSQAVIRPRLVAAQINGLAQPLGYGFLIHCCSYNQVMQRHTGRIDSRVASLQLY